MKRRRKCGRETTIMNAGQTRNRKRWLQAHQARGTARRAGPRIFHNLMGVGGKNVEGAPGKFIEETNALEVVNLDI